GTPVEERAQPLLALGARAPSGRDLAGRRPPGSLADEAFRLADGLRAAREESRHDRFHRLIRRIGDLVDEADAERRRGVEPLAGEEVAPRRLADLLEHERGDDGRDDPETDLREPEDGVRRGNGDV